VYIKPNGGVGGFTIVGNAGTIGNDPTTGLPNI
jgi:hypothetical protein